MQKTTVAACCGVLVAGTVNVTLKNHMASAAGGFYYPMCWNFVTMCGMSLALPIHRLLQRSESAETQQLLTKAADTKEAPLRIYAVVMLFHWWSLLIVNSLYLYLPGALLQMMRGSKVPFTAALSFLILGKALQFHQQASLLVIMLGLTLGVQSCLDQWSFRGSFTTREHGFWSVVFLSFASELIRSVMFVYQEKYVKQYKIPALKMSGAVGCMGALFSFQMLVIAQLLQIEDVFGMLLKLRVSPMASLTLFGFLVSVCLFEVGGIYITACSSAFTRAVVELIRTPIVWIVEIRYGIGAWSLWQLSSFLMLALGLLLDVCGAFIFDGAK
eukprot:TRINITY_DN6064_c0_g1_i2.p1 TRINITY_DN6064_c0_g1~~TRINITY_DN6064_c0_g1_i2.p1  ORF type:complete len:351 (-),score=60.98 TRINITY_DN6064_c0_g1_i2:91-1077(-)